MGWGGAGLARRRRGPFKAWPTWQPVEPPPRREVCRALPAEAAAGERDCESGPAAAAMGQNDLMGTAEDVADQVGPGPRPPGQGRPGPALPGRLAPPPPPSPRGAGARAGEAAGPGLGREKAVGFAGTWGRGRAVGSPEGDWGARTSRAGGADQGSPGAGGRGAAAGCSGPRGSAAG